MLYIIIIQNGEYKGLQEAISSENIHRIKNMFRQKSYVTSRGT